jgi:outer membrane protein assembly factor BamB
LKFVASTGGVTDGTYFYVGSTHGWYYSIMLQEAISNWALGTNSMLTAPPALQGNRVFVAGTDSTVRSAMVGREPKKSWERSLGGAVNAPMALTDKACLVPCDDNRLYAFQPVTGLNLWKQPFICRAPLREPPQVGPTTVFQRAQGDSFYAINLVSGQKRWENADALTVLALVNNNAYLLDKQNNLMVVDEVLGTVKASLPLSGYDRYVANTTAPAIYIGNHDGRLACLRLESAGYLKPEDMSAKP